MQNEWARLKDISYLDIALRCGVDKVLLRACVILAILLKQ
jgi:hypothetical protein